MQASAQQQQEVHASNVTAAEAELTALVAAAAQHQDRQAEVAARVQQLRQEQQDQQALVEAAESRLQALRQRHYQAAAAAHKAGAAAAAAEARLAELDRLPAAASPSSAGGGRQSADEAVAALAAASAAGQLPGAFHGRLHSVARLASQPSGVAVGTAVNAALMETCSLVSLPILCSWAAVPAATPALPTQQAPPNTRVARVPPAFRRRAPHWLCPTAPRPTPS